MAKPLSRTIPSLFDFLPRLSAVLAIVGAVIAQVIVFRFATQKIKEAIPPLEQPTTSAGIPHIDTEGLRRLEPHLRSATREPTEERNEAPSDSKNDNTIP
jgi:hypothetical protein